MKQFIYLKNNKLPCLGAHILEYQAIMCFLRMDLRMAEAQDSALWDPTCQCSRN